MSAAPDAARAAGRAVRPASVAGAMRRAARSACPRAGRHRPACRYAVVAEHPEHVVAQLEGLAEGPAVGRAAAGRARASRPASAAPRCNGRSMVYLPDLYRAIRRARRGPASPRAARCRASRYWPMLSSMRSSFHTDRPPAARRTAARRRRRRRGHRPARPRPRRSGGVAAPAGAAVAAAKSSVHRRAPTSVAEPSITSSWSNAKACSSSKPAATSTTTGRPGPAGPEKPSGRRPAAAACRPERRTRPAAQPVQPSQGSTAAHRACSSARTSRRWPSTLAVIGAVTRSAR